LCLKNYSSSTWMVWCVTSQNVLFYKAIVVWGGAILKSAIQNQEFGCNIFFFEHSKIIAIWSCMLLENVMHVLHLLVPQTFVDQFVFIWGCEQCTKTFGQLTTRTYYYLKDLNHVHFACRGYPWDRRHKVVYWQWAK
jgi:hypothetical protein